MTHPRLTSALLGATALGLAFGAPASAQTTEANACDVLTELIEEAGANISPDFADAAEIAQMSDGNACLLYIDRVDEAGGITAIAPTEGQATVEQGQQAGATELQADVQVITPDEQQTGQETGQATGQTAQTGQQEAAPQPQAQQAETQQETGQQTTTEGAAEQTATEEAATEVPAAEQATTEEAVTEEPATEEAAAEQPAEEAATEEPATEEAATEEPASEEAAAEEPATEEAAAEEPATEEVAAEPVTQEGGEQEAAAAEEAEAGIEVAVSDITGRQVVTAEGEEVGEIDRLVVINDEPHAIFKRGGFFGLGSDDVAVPAAQLQMQGEELILTGVGTDEFEAMPEFEAETEAELAAEDTVRIGAAE